MAAAITVLVILSSLDILRSNSTMKRGIQMSKITKTFAATFFIALFTATVTAGPPITKVEAHQGEDHSNTSVLNDDTTQTSEPKLKRDTLTEDSAQIRGKVQALQAEAKAKVEEKRKSGETLSAENRTKVCENRKTAINNKLESFTTAAEKHLTRLNAVNGKIVAFQERKQIVLANNDALTLDTNAKKQAATDATAALSQLTAEVDCSDPEAATTLRAARDAAHSARKALQEYRVALKNLVVAITEAQAKLAEKKAE